MIEELRHRARSAESNSEYNKAAAGFFAIGSYNMFSEMFENTRHYREGICNLLRSIELDERGGIETRAEWTAEFLRENIYPLLADENEAIVRGLGHEWVGDSFLLCGNPDARGAYRQALEAFETVGFEAQLHMGACPEYDVAFLALRRFFDRHQIEYYARHDIDFAGRVEWKLEMCDELLE